MIIPGTELVFVDQKGRAVREPDAIEQDAEWIRTRLAPAPVKGQIKSPDDIIEDLEWAKHLSARAAVIIHDADEARRAVRREWSIAHGKALRESTGKSAEQREADAYEATLALQVLVDETEILYDFARNVARSVEGTASAVQTQSKMVAITYGLAGSGRER